jgi:hypothetical protein
MSIFFSEDEQDFHYNACVGENTAGDNSFGYKWGFEQAVSILSSAAIQGEYHDPTLNEEESQEYACLDVVIYPVCFCARHFIELFIKHHSKKILSLLKTKSKKLKFHGMFDMLKHVHGHNLNDLFNNLKELAIALDSRLSSELTPISEFIYEFSKIDPTGEVFRYHSDKENNLHLSDVSRINILNFHHSFKLLKYHTDKFDFFMDMITEEYKQGTYTENLSRNDICTLSKRLPAIDEWHDKTKVNKIKIEFSKEFDVSKREIEKAIKIIRSNFEFSANIKSEIIIDAIALDSISLITRTDKDWHLLSEITDYEWHCLYSIIECGVGFTYCETYSRHLDEFGTIYIDKNYIGRHVAILKTKFLKGLENLHQETIITHYKKCINL